MNPIDIEKIMNEYNFAFVHFKQSNNKNILISPYKLCGSKPKTPKEDKSFLYLDSGVIAEQGEPAINIIDYLVLYHGINKSEICVKLQNNKSVNVQNSKITKPENNKSVNVQNSKITNVINYIQNLNHLNAEDNFCAQYFFEQRGINCELIFSFLSECKYDIRLGQFNLYIPLSNGYQKLVFDSAFKKQKNLTRIIKHKSTKPYYYKCVYRVESPVYQLLLEGIEDCLALLCCFKSENYFKMLENIFKPYDMNITNYNSNIICCFGKQNMLNIAGNLNNSYCILDNDGIDIFLKDISKPFKKIILPTEYKDFNHYFNEQIYG